MAEGENRVPRDEYSVLLRTQQDNPGAVVKTSSVDLIDFYGNAATWTVKTVRIESRDTVFLQCVDAQGGRRLVLPPEVTGAIARQREGIWQVNRRRAGHKAAAARAAKKRGEDR